MAAGRSKTRLLVTTGVAGVVLPVVLWFLWAKPPQLGADEELFSTVDALFTAVTAQDEKRLSECEQRLRGYKEAGKLPSEAADYLHGIIDHARAGQWRPAAERLYHFMLAQRRE